MLLFDCVRKFKEKNGLQDRDDKEIVIYDKKNM